MTRFWSALVLGPFILLACSEPDDTLFVRPPVPPAEIAPGLFRLTWSETADVVRGFSVESDRIVYQSRDLPGFARGVGVFSASISDGSVREEAGIYRLALQDTTSHIILGAASRLHVAWHTTGPGGVTCDNPPDPCPAPPPATDVAIRRLPLTDGAAINSLPIREFTIPNNSATARLCAGGGSDPVGEKVLRVRPAEREIALRRVNPFGPAERADGTAGFFSDGETVWRYDPADPAAPPVPVGPGAFPALSPDGARLAAAIPTGVDSTSGQCFAGLCPCSQTTWTITAAGWSIVLYDLSGGAADTLAAGLEPVFDPLEPRILVRRPDALHWVTLATGESTEIAGTGGGYAPAISPDGALLAFTAQRFDSPDVFFLRIR
jgi:hypothetical protein